MKNEENYVLVVGSSNMDLNMYSKRFPTPGETVTGGRFTQSFGGKGANQAVASIRSGSKTVFVGKVGKDFFGSQMLEQLTNEGINTKSMMIDPEAASGVAMILIDSNGQNMISVAPGANKKLTEKDLENVISIIENATVVIIQMEIKVEVIQKIINISFEKNTISILNPAPFKEIPLEVLKQVDIITPNENELLKLYRSLGFKESNETKNENLQKITNDLHSCGIKKIVVTLGNKGCFVSDGNTGEQFQISAFEVDAIDAVGAGDCFNGVLASRLSKEDKLQVAVQYANVAASIAVTRSGAQSSMPYQNEIEQKYADMYR
ncbi:MAG: ribokinase [Candidatus Hodarchaeales archaeon]|jgi:ribokinase